MSHRYCRSRPGIASIGLVLALAACGREPAPIDGGDSAVASAEAAAREPERWEHDVVAVHPHDPRAFTQGLAFHDGFLLEGTGRRGESVLRRVRIETGEVVHETPLPPTLFGEGIAVVGDSVVQLTWTARLGFVYDLDTFERRGQFRQISEGWGLTWTGAHLVQSDGSARLFFLDPESFAPVRTVDVTESGRPVDQLNELEFVEGEIWANVWHSDEILRISPDDGRVLGRIALGGLLEPGVVSDPEAVLNGIAHDPATGRIWVTGKLWPRLFEIRLRESP